MIDSLPKTELWTDKLDWSSLDEKSAIYIFEQAEKQIDSKESTCRELEKKLFSLITILVTVTTGLLGIVAGSFEGSIPLLQQPSPMVIPSLIFFSGAFIALCFALCGIKPRDYAFKGNLPEGILSSDNYKYGYEQLIKGAFITYNDIIKMNLKSNGEKAYCLTASIIIFALSILISFASVFIF